MKDLIDFLSNNWVAIAQIIIAAHGVALLVVNLTPTPKDDTFLRTKIYPWIERLAGIVSSKVKE